MKIILSTLLLVASLAASCDAVQVACTFQNGASSLDSRALYQCHTTSAVMSSENQIVTEVTGTHLTDKTNDDVKYLYLYPLTFYYLPLEFDKFFKNIESLFIYPSYGPSYGVGYGIKQLNREDLKQFKKLRELSISYGQLTQLENDVFDYTPNIEYLYLYTVGISYLGSDFLGPLKYIKYAYISNCYASVANTEALLETLRTTLKSACLPTAIMKRHEIIRRDYVMIEKERDEMTRNLQRTSKKLELTEKYADDLKDNLKDIMETCSSTNSIENNCSLNDAELNSARIDFEKCAAEKNELENFKKQVVSIPLICDIKKQSDSVFCTALNFEVYYQEFEIKAVFDKDKEQVKGDTVQGLIIEDQQILYLPLLISSQFPQLNVLFVINSRLLKLSDDVFYGMSNLEYLNLTKNVLAEIDESSFSPLVRLKELDLSWNKLEKIDVQAFLTLGELVDLKLNDNLIAELKGKTFSNLGKLKNLNLHNNKLKFIGTTLLHKLTAIQNVDISNNVCINMTYPKDTLNAMNQIITSVCAPPAELCCEYLSYTTEYLCNSKKLVIENPITKLISVKSHHECSGNKAGAVVENINNNQQTLTEVTILQIVNEKVNYLPDDISKFLPNLKKISVIKSELTAIEKNNFAGLNKLLVLLITGNNITFIADDAFDELPQLLHLDISKNGIKSLPIKIFDKLQHLKFLNAAHNSLARLGTASNGLFGRKNSLEEIYFNDNPIEEINRRLLQPLKSLQVANFKETECIDAEFPKTVSTFRELQAEIAMNC